MLVFRTREMFVEEMETQSKSIVVAPKEPVHRKMADMTGCRDLCCQARSRRLVLVC